MRWPWSHVVRAGERRRTLIAALFLVLFFAGQAVLEAARDTLFLSKVPATRLPWMYIVIALLSFVVARVEERRGRRRADRKNNRVHGFCLHGPVTGA